MTLNDAADGIVAVVGAIDNGIRFYPEPVEEHAGSPSVTGEITFANMAMVGPTAGGRWTVDATLLITTRASQGGGWAAAIRRNRGYMSPHGDKSIIQAILADDTLGGRVVSCLPKQGGMFDERRIEFADGDRWTQELVFVVRLGA